MKGLSRFLACGVAALLLTLLACPTNTLALQLEEQSEGPYEDIQNLLASAAAASSDLEALDTRGPPRVIEVHHHHDHSVPAGVSQQQAERIAEDNTPAPPRIHVIAMPNRARTARHAQEDADYHAAVNTPSVGSLTVEHTVSVSTHDGKPVVLNRNAQPYTIIGQRGNKDADGSLHAPLVDRGLQRAHFAVIAETDGSEKADWKPHTAAELQAEALKLLSRAKQLQERKNMKAAAGAGKAESEAMGVFDQKDEGYEDELTRLKRVSARMNRLLEQIQTPRPDDSFEGHIARQKYYLKIYRQLKKDATQIIEGYALRTGNSIFTLFGDGKIDPSIAAFLPPNSVAAILAQYANPNRGRTDETPRDLISGKDAKRIQYAIDYHKAKSEGTRMPLPPRYALTDEEEAALAKHNNPLLNKVVAVQDGAFGQGRPAVTTGNQAIGRSSVHIAVVNPTENQHSRGLPYQVNLKVAQ